MHVSSPASVVDDLPTKISAAIDGFDWPAARAALDQYFAASPGDWNGAAQLAAKMMDWTAVLKAEAGHITRTGKSHPADLPPPLARVAIQARRRLDLGPEALEMIRACRQRAPGRVDLARREAETLVQIGEFEAALAMARELWTAGGNFGAVIIATCLIEMDRQDECRAFFLESKDHQDAADRRAEFLRARLLFWNSTKNHEQALGAALKLRAESDGVDALITVAEQAAAARDHARLETMLSEAYAWADTPESATLFLQVAPTIVGAHYEVWLDREKLQPVIARLADHVLVPRSARPICQILLQAGEYDLAEHFGRRTLSCFPSTPAFWRQYLHILSLIGDQEALAAARARMKAQIPEQTYLAAMSLAEPRSWDLDDLADLLAYNLAQKRGKQQAKFFSSLSEAALNEDQVAMLRAAAESGTPTIRAEIDLMLFPMQDRERLERSIEDPVGFREFETTRAGARARVVQATKDAVDGLFTDGSNGHGMVDCLRLTARIQRNRQTTHLYTRESYADAVSVARLLADRIASRTPTSIIRLGDGEGHFLPGPAANREYNVADRAVMLNIWWGSRRVDPDKMGKIADDFVRSVDNSSIIAIIPQWRHIVEMAKEDFTTVHRGIWGGIHYTANMENTAAAITSMHFPNDFHNWNLWRELFAGLSSVSYISCHHVAPYLRDTFGIATRTAIHIPGEHQFSALFEKPQGVDAHETLYDRHDDVCAAIAPEPGEVFLVAAGFLGKIYCETVRERGGVAIDIGSLADYWMGHATRRYRLEQRNDVGAPATHIIGHPLR